MVEIIPSILTNNANDILKLLIIAEKKVSRIQIDIDDGSFLGNKTIDPILFEKIETDLFLDFHLMVDNPISWITRCVNANADRIIGQIEKMSGQPQFVEKVLRAGRKVGLAIDLDTPIDKIEDFLLINLDVVLLMSVNAGLGGQKFSENVFAKIEKLDNLRKEKSAKFRICIDGGVTSDRIKKLEELGVDEVVEGRSWFKNYE